MLSRSTMSAPASAASTAWSGVVASTSIFFVKLTLVLALRRPLAASKSKKRQRFLYPRHYCFFFTEYARFRQHLRVYERVRGYVGMSDVFSYERLESLFRDKKAGVQATSGRDLRVLI